VASSWIKRRRRSSPSWDRQRPRRAQRRRKGQTN